MPKKSIEINPFDGGLNNYADARDIKENELAAATNINTDQPGRIKIGRRIDSGTTRAGGPNSVNAGRGVFQYNSDFNASNAGTPTEYQLIYHNNALYRRDTSTTNFTSIASLGASYDPTYSVLDGNVRLSDAALSSDTKFIGVTNVDDFGNNQAAALTVVNTYIDPPTAGAITFDPNTPANSPSSQNTNYIDMIVQKKTGSTEDWFTFDPADSSDKTFAAISNGATSTSNNVYESLSPFSNNFSSAADIASTHNLNGTNVNASTNQYYRVGKTQTVDFSECRITFPTGQEISYEDRSVFFEVYIPSSTKNNLEATALIVELGNSETDHYTYNIASSAIDADQWTTIELAYAAHDDIDGSPNATGIKYFKCTAKFQNSSKTESNGNDVEWGIDNLKIGEISRGTWNGRFRFFYTWIYDKTQESIPFQFGNQTNSYEVASKILQFRAHMKLSSSPGNNDRITGANVYYIEYDLDDNPLDTDKKLLLEIDVENGIKKTGAESFRAWGDAQGSNTGFEAPHDTNHTAFVQIFDPPVLQTFSTKAGYDEDDKLKKVKYKTTTLMNRRAYVGNVNITDQNGKETRYSDRVYKSEPNKPDIFTENGFIDVAINDGEQITALAHFGDMLLQYKERTMYLINCTQEIEYLEDEAKFRGVWGQSAVCTTDEGIVWVNKYGLFLFNGREILSLIDNKIDPNKWSSEIGAKPIIAFEPLNRSVLIVGDSDASSNGFTFSMKAKGFNFINNTDQYDLFQNDMTNIVNSNDGTVSWYQVDSSNVKEYKWVNATNNVYIEILTRDQDFRDPARRKMIKNVYITYKLPSGQGVPTVKFRTNGGTTNYNFDTALSAGYSDWNTIQLKPSTSAQASNIFSMQIYIYGSAGKDFEINDINVVYRDKVLK